MVNHPCISLKTALSAYNDGDYPTAITHLESIYQTSEDEQLRVEAPKKLVQAYQKNDQLEAAIALCQDLLNDPIHQDWASKAIEKLENEEILEDDEPVHSELINKTNPNLSKSAETSIRQWRNAGRSEVIKPLRRPSPFRLGWVLLATCVTLVWLLSLMTQGILGFINRLFTQLSGTFDFFPYLYLSPISSDFILWILLIFMIISPWLLDIFLRQSYRLQPLALEKLAVYSSESVEILRTFAEKKRIKKLNLQILSLEIPIILTYGHFPRNARIVISRGLLKQLENDEIATLYATQLGQMSQWDFPWISGMLGLLQIPYCLYWQIIKIGTRMLPDRFNFLASSLALVCYGIYRLWRIPILWLSRQRVYYSDHFAVNLTGNPNALSRALVKTAIGITDTIKKQRSSPWMLDSFDILLPVEPRQVLCLGSVPPETNLEPILRWDCENIFRHWLVLSNSHPLLGERIYLLSRHAQFYHLTTEFDLVNRRPSLRHKGEFFWKLIHCYQALPVWQSAVLFAFGMGILLRCLFWLIGRLGEQMKIDALIWLYNAHPFLNAWVMWVLIMVVVMFIFLFSHRFPHIFAYAVLLRFSIWLFGQFVTDRFVWLHSIDPFFNAWVAIALSMSLIISMNRYFPNLSEFDLIEDCSLSQLLSEVDTLPSDSVGIRFQGTLLGRRGMGNWLGQDLLLRTPSGMVQLRYTPWGGFFSLILPWVRHPCDWVNRSVTVQGWLRRGSSPWVDVETLEAENQKPLKGHYPLWLTLVAIASALWGAYRILKL